MSNYRRELVQRVIETAIVFAVLTLAWWVGVTFFPPAIAR